TLSTSKPALDPSRQPMNWAERNMHEWYYLIWWRSKHNRGGAKSAAAPTPIEVRFLSPALEIFRQRKAIRAVLVVTRHAPQFAKPVFGIEVARPPVGQLHHEPEPGDAAPPETAQRAVHEGGRRTLAAEGRRDRHGDQFSPSPQPAGGNGGDRVGAYLSTQFRDQEQAPAFVGIFCKQVAIVCVRAETGGFDIQDPVQIALPDAAHYKSFVHSVILYFGVLEEA